MSWEHLDHASEMGVAAFGRTLGEAFAEAARGVLAIQLEGTPSGVPRAVSCRGEGEDPAECLADYLGNLLVLQDLLEVILVDVSVPVLSTGPSGFSADGDAAALPREAATRHLATEVKAVTWQGLLVEEVSGGWRVRVVVDV